MPIVYLLEKIEIKKSSLKIKLTKYKKINILIPYFIIVHLKTNTTITY